MNYELTQEQLSLSKKAREFAEDFLDPIATGLDQSGAFPKATVDELGAQEFLGLVLPKAFGGAAAGFVSYVEVVQAFSRSCPAIASVLNSHSLAAAAIARWGSEVQQGQLLPALARGPRLGALAVYENGPAPGAGPDALLARREGDDFILSGTKTFVRNGGVADLYVAFATLQSPPAERPVLAAFIVDARTPGLTAGPSLETMGLRGCPVSHLVFKDVRLPEDALLGGVDNALPVANTVLHMASVFEAAQTVGIGHAAAAHAAEFAKRRVQFGHPISGFQAIQTLLAEIAADSHLAWLGIQRTAQLMDDGAPFETEAAMVKAFLARFGSRMLTNAIQVEGGLGISEAVPFGVSGSLPLARLFRDIAGTILLDAPADFPDRLISESIGG
jgi:alkylation response protein AidB-like acyl-CoA dehydrogenase